MVAIGRFLLEQLGHDVRLLFVFDRAGAFPEHMATLRVRRISLLTTEGTQISARA